MVKQLNLGLPGNPDPQTCGGAPSFVYESQYKGVVAGVDEVGIGSWVGPVLACAVIIKPNAPQSLLTLLQDSKKLSLQKREAIYETLITTDAIIYNVGQADLQEIADLNIRQATFLAMQRAIKGLATPPDVALVDGNARPPLPCQVQMIIKGDQKSYSIAAASIIAKVTRDRIIMGYANDHPGYGWHTNAGYGTAGHRKALEKQGVTPYHRKSYAPIKKILDKKLEIPK